MKYLLTIIMFFAVTSICYSFEVLRNISNYDGDKLIVCCGHDMHGYSFSHKDFYCIDIRSEISPDIAADCINEFEEIKQHLGERKFNIIYFEWATPALKTDDVLKKFYQLLNPNGKLIFHDTTYSLVRKTLTIEEKCSFPTFEDYQKYINLNNLIFIENLFSENQTQNCSIYYNALKRVLSQKLEMDCSSISHEDLGVADLVLYHKKFIDPTADLIELFEYYSYEDTDIDVENDPRWRLILSEIHSSALAEELSPEEFKESSSIYTTDKNIQQRSAQINNWLKKTLGISAEIKCADSIDYYKWPTCLRLSLNLLKPLLGDSPDLSYLTFPDLIIVTKKEQ